MIKIGYLYGATKASVVNDITAAVERSVRKGIVPTAVELHPFYELSEFTGLKVIVTESMPVGQVFVGKDDEDV